MSPWPSGSRVFWVAALALAVIGCETSDSASSSRVDTVGTDLVVTHNPAALEAEVAYQVTST